MPQDTVIDPERPKRRLGQEWDTIWDLVQCCMSREPTNRPTAPQLVERLETMRCSNRKSDMTLSFRDRSFLVFSVLCLFCTLTFLYFDFSVLCLLCTLSPLKCLLLFTSN